MKDFYLNELSLKKAQNIEEAQSIIKNLIYSASSLRRYGFNALRMTKNINELEIASEYYVHQWRNDEDVPRELRTRFRSIITQVPLIDSNDSILVEDTRKTDIYFQNQAISSLTAAYVDDSIVLSLLTSTDWNTAYIKAELMEINDFNDLLSSNTTIRNVSKIEHLIDHIDWIKESVDSPEFIYSNPLPFRTISNNLEELDNERFYGNIIHRNTDEKISIYRIVSRNIASLNFYSFKAQLTQKNNNRYIFQSPVQTIYLALDTQHGRFEVCNKKGKHQGEFDFYGKQTKGADDEGKHDIKI